MESTPSLRRRWPWGLILGPALWLSSLALAGLPAVADAVYARGVGAWLGWLMSRLTGWIPWAVVELVLLWLLARQAQLVWRGIGSLRGKTASWRGVAGGARRFLCDVGWVVAGFYLLWGFHYARPNLAERWQWPAEPTPIQTEEIVSLARQLIGSTNDAYLRLHGSDDAGQPTGRASLADLDQKLEEAWATAAPRLDLARVRGFKHGPVKSPWISPLLSRLGISGVYSPWTGEANLNRQIPGSRVPQTMAHEKAHQRGFASEDEANFLGFLVAATTEDPWARYSALLFAQRQLLRTLQRTDGELVQSLLTERLPGVQRDVDDIAAFWAKHRGGLQRLASRTNDLYLKSHGVAGGRQSYSRSVELLVHYARLHEGNPIPDWSHE